MPNSPTPYDVAAAFCRQVDAPDLLAYLGLPSDVTPEEATEALRERRRVMQGRQGHPQHGREAKALIAQFATFRTVLDDLAAYRQDVLRRARSVHLPVLEMTIRNVLARGRLSPEDAQYLARNARELGVDDADYRATLGQVARELGVPLQGPFGLATAATGIPARERSQAPSLVEAPRQPFPWAVALFAGVIVLVGAGVWLAL